MNTDIGYESQKNELVVSVSDIFSINKDRTTAARNRGPFILGEYLRQSCAHKVSIPPEFVLNLTEISSSTGPFYVAQLPDTWRTVVLPRDCEYVQLPTDETYGRFNLVDGTGYQLVEKRSYDNL